MYLIADRLTVTGFRLSGLKDVYVADKDSIGAVLLEVSDKAKIILVTTTLAAGAQREIVKLRKANKVIIEIPDKSGPGQDFVTKMIKDVIGFELKK
jgi:vacuolar-type H+-ATPase subunit F/Vma7